MSPGSGTVPDMATPAPVNVEVPTAADSAARSPIAWPAVGSAALAVIAVLAATSARYGYHRDELYFLMLPLAWGYVDQPPLTPLLARGGAALFGDTPTGMRVPAMLCVGLGILFIALIARELGGDRGAQALAAWGYGFAAIPMLSGHLMVTATVDLPLWSAVLLLVTRALLRDEPRWWLGAGAVAGLAMYNKLLVAILFISLAAGLLAVGPRKVFRSGWLWGAVGLALAIGAPNIIYQATHHFPQLTMAGAISDNGQRLQLLPFQLLLIGVPLVPVCYLGLTGLFRRNEWRPVRPIAVAYLVSVGLTLVAGGQIYYPFGLLAFVFAAGTVPTTEWIARAGIRRRRWPVRAVALNAVISAVISLPLLPVDLVGHTPVVALNPTVGDEVGWPTYVHTLAGVYQALPASDKANAVIFTGNYGEAGAIVRYGAEYGLPAVYSGQNELYFHGPPPEADTTVVVWNESPRHIESIFDGCQIRATMDNGVGVDNEEQGSAVLVCRVPPAGWASTWPRLQHYD